MNPWIKCGYTSPMDPSGDIESSWWFFTSTHPRKRCAFVVKMARLHLIFIFPKNRGEHYTIFELSNHLDRNPPSYSQLLCDWGVQTKSPKRNENRSLRFHETIETILSFKLSHDPYGVYSGSSPYKWPYNKWVTGVK